VRVAACVVGILGGFFGIYFGQLLVTSTALLSLVAAAIGVTSTDTSGPFLFGLLTLVFYTVGVAGGVVALVRPGIGAFLLLCAAVGGLAATIAVGPAAANLFPQTQTSVTPTPRPFVTLVPARTPSVPAASSPPIGATTWILVSFPFAGPALLLVGSALAGLAVRGSSPSRLVAAATTAVMARRAELVWDAPVHLLSGPSTASRSAYGAIAPHVQFDVFAQHGEFVHVRGKDFEGYLPVASVRLL
jgi:hypothetical protein